MKNSIYKKGYISTESFVDVETGEILSVNSKQHGYIANSKEEFLLIYSSLLSVFIHMEQSEIRVYSYLLRYANSIEFSITKPLREKIAKETNLNERTVYNTIQSLKKKKLIIEDSKLFIVNPRYAFKGSSLERNNKLKAVIELKCRDC